MRFFRKLFSNQRGMTMAEMVVTAGLAGVAAMGVASLMKSMGGSGKEGEIVIERTQFASALGVFLHSAKGCYSLKNTTAFPSTPVPYVTQDWVENGKPKEFRFDGFKNFGTTPGATKDLRLNSIKYLEAQTTDLPNVNPITLTVSGAQKTLKKAIIKIRLAVTDKSRESDPALKAAEEAKFAESRWEYNIPVLVNSSSGLVEICGDDSTMAEACFAVKGMYEVDALGNAKCDLPKTCESFGSFAIVDCQPKFASVSCQDYSRGTPFVNPVTGSYSCPTGATALTTGGQTWYRTIDCGKKCEARVNFSIGYYSCLKCED